MEGGGVVEGRVDEIPFALPVPDKKEGGRVRLVCTRIVVWNIFVDIDNPVETRVVGGVYGADGTDRWIRADSLSR